MSQNLETIVLGGGCFWCTEAVFTMLRGVVSVAPGVYGWDDYKSDV
ncbi:MAG: peptide-methionine (S)-S-oxide reductase [bacterium]